MEEKYFLVDVIEHYSRTVKVKATNWDEAFNKVEKAWKEKKIVMNSDDYADGEIPGGRDVEDNEDLSMYMEVEG